MLHPTPLSEKNVAVNSIQQLSVLLVDDSKIILKRMKELLSEVPCIQQLHISEDGLSAIELIKQTIPDVVLLDINLPGTNGIEVLKYIKEFHPFVKVMMVTNHAKDEYKLACLKIGAEYFIDKTTEFENIPALLEEISKQKNN